MKPLARVGLLAALSRQATRPSVVAMAQTRAGSTCRPVVSGIAFDMDGTLTVPCIDFIDMRRRCGVVQGDILDVINSWPQQRRQQAFAVIAEIEAEALARMQIMPGVQELCALCDAAGIPRGLVTRNVSTSVEHLHGHLAGLGLASPFQPAISRESSFAYKPSPEALLHMATVWGVPATQLLMVGDSVKDDIVSGNRAGALTALLDLDGVNGYRGAQLEGEQKPTFIVHSLHELLDLLRGAVDLEAPGAPAAFKPGESVPAA